MILQKLLNKYPEGSDITLMNCMYQYSIRDEEGNRKPDFIIIVYKDNETGKKGHVIIKKPKYVYYMLKEEYWKDVLNINNIKAAGITKVTDKLFTDPRYSHPELFIDDYKVAEIEVEYRKLEKDIAIQIGDEAGYNDAVAAGDREYLRKLHKDTRLFNSDQSIEDKYRLEFSKLYTNSIGKLNKAYFDIEVDIRYSMDEFVSDGSCPINAISLLNESTEYGYSFLLRDKNNPLIEKFENEYKSKQFTNQDIYNFVCDSVGGMKKMIRLV